MAKEVLQYLVDLGLLDVVLPFIVAFTASYGVLRRSEVLGDRENVNLMVAFVMGFLTVGATVALQVTSTIMAYFVVLVVAGLLFAMILSLTGASEGKWGWKLLGGAMMILLGIIAIYALDVNNVIDVSNLLTLNFLWPLIVLIVLIGTTIYVLRPYIPESKKEGTDEGKKGKKKPVTKQKPSYSVDAQDVEKKGEDFVLKPD